MVTIGQRKGMATAGGTNPRYAINVDVPNATVTVGTPEDLLVESTSVKDCVWANQLTNGPVLVQISAHGKPMEATLKDNTIYWEEPQRRVAPGQAIVFYDNDEVLGGGMAC
jgi:tRNA-specific 2-thiouridylase